MVAYRYWSILIKTSQSNDYSQLSVLKFLSNGTNLAVTKTAFTASSAYYSGFDLTHGGPPQTANGDWVSGTPSVPQRLFYDFGSAVAIDQVILYSSTDTNFARGPSGFTVDVSTDAITWTSVTPIIAPATWNASNQAQTFATSTVASTVATNALVSQSRLEILGASRPGVMVAQSRLEVLGQTRPAALVSQSFLEVLFRPSSNTPGPRPRRVFVAMT